MSDRFMDFVSDYVAPVVICVLLAIFVGGIVVGTVCLLSQAAQAGPESHAAHRFTRERVDGTLSLLTDAVSGRQYLANERGGLIEVTAAPAESKP